MTAQIPDRFTYRNKQYDLAGINGEGLFHPAKFNMTLAGASSACWRGFVAHYDVRHNSKERLTHLRMQSLHVSAEDSTSLPLLMYGAPLEIREQEKPDEDSGFIDLLGRMFQCEYSNCPEPVPFTGGILLADGFIRELYTHMGFHPAWKYREVHELIFKKGILTEAHDRSSAMAEHRAEQAGARPKFNSPEEHLAWIADTFNLRYDREQMG